LHLNAPSSFGLRRDDLIVKDGDMFAVDDRLATYEKWRDSRAEMIQRGAQPSVRVQTATAWAAEQASLGIETPIEPGTIEILQIPGRGGSPSRSALRHARACRARDDSARRLRRSDSARGRHAGADHQRVRGRDPGRRRRRCRRCCATT
jgi:hypothetical protein